MLMGRNAIGRGKVGGTQAPRIPQVPKVHPPSCADIYNGWCCSGAQNSNSGDLDGPSPETLCKLCSWRCPLARNAPEQHSGAQKYLSMVMWVPQGCPSASFFGFFRAILASDGAAKKKKNKIVIFILDYFLLITTALIFYVLYQHQYFLFYCT